ncbi:TadE/TadG family type IV pilus assembly protein [Bordetella sp. LUAb4]|uniref:TadE/TadG family type IV pilus assembly protein n=1 Tax=Bordetella sp. LUAb4 TaxID=2843195 RepID=UPI001E2AA536|nr:TadE family protein [Bordetella sp. LUAb4]
MHARPSTIFRMRLACRLSSSPRARAAVAVGAGAVRQRGVAALEFALILSVFLLVFMGIVGLGGVMWAQQVLTGAAAEGARAVLDSGQAGAVKTAEGCRVANKAASWMQVTCAATTNTCAWSSGGASPAQCVAVSLRYSTAGWPLLALVNTLSSSLWGTTWIPTVLSANAVVQIQGSS